jgi:hypothetical protein
LAKKDVSSKPDAYEEKRIKIRIARSGELISREEAITEGTAEQYQQQSNAILNLAMIPTSRKLSGFSPGE